MGLRGRRSKNTEVEPGLESSGDETFAESQGLPANAHAKKLAKEKAAKEKKATPKGVFYTIRGTKILKVMVKPHGTYTDYIGNMKRHQDGLEPMVKKWKAEGVWVGADSVDAKIKELQSQLVKK